MASEQPTEKQQKPPLPKVVTLDKAFKLAQEWVGKMSTSGADEPSNKDFEGRPSRLGLGARVATNVKRAAPTDPIERRLLEKVNAQKRKTMEEGNRAAQEANEVSDDNGDGPESRTSAVSKKRAPPLGTSLPSKKKGPLGTSLPLKKKGMMSLQGQSFQPII